MCALPLMQPQFAMLKTEHTFIQGLTLDRMVNRFYADLLVKLYNQEIPWTQVGRPDNQVAPIPLVDDSLRELGFSGSYLLQMAPRSRGRDKNADGVPQKYLLEAQYTFENLKNTLKEKPVVYKFLVNVKTPTAAVNADANPTQPKVPSGTPSQSIPKP